MGRAVFQDGQLVGLVSLVGDWYEPQSREAQRAWVVQFLAPGVEGLSRAVVELNGQPTIDTARLAELAKKAKALVVKGPPATPAPFAYASTGLGTLAEICDLIQLTNHGMEVAQGRVFAAARDERPEAVMPLLVAATELMAWLRGLDELAAYVWKERLTERSASARLNRPTGSWRPLVLRRGCLPPSARLVKRTESRTPTGQSRCWPIRWGGFVVRS